MARRWKHGDTLRPNSRPGDYLPALPSDESVLTSLDREVRHRLTELRKLDPWTFREVAVQQQLKDTFKNLREAIDAAEQHIMTNAGRKSLFDGMEGTDSFAASA